MAASKAADFKAGAKVVFLLKGASRRLPGQGGFQGGGFQGGKGGGGLGGFGKKGPADPNQLFDQLARNRPYFLISEAPSQYAIRLWPSPKKNN